MTKKVKKRYFKLSFMKLNIIGLLTILGLTGFLLLLYWNFVKGYYDSLKNIKDCRSVIGINGDSVVFCLNDSCILTILILNIVVYITKKHNRVINDYQDIKDQLVYYLVFSAIASLKVANDFSKIYNTILDNLNTKYTLNGEQLCVYSLHIDSRTYFLALAVTMPIFLITYLLTRCIVKENVMEWLLNE